jgi:hypothetical protein
MHQYGRTTQRRCHPADFKQLLLNILSGDRLMPTIKSKPFVVFAIAMVCVVACFVARFPALGQDSDSAKSKLTSLLEERRDVLKTRVDMMERLAKIARSTPEEVIAARDGLYDAEYELATNSEQRLNVLQQKLENAKQLELVMQQHKRDAKANETHVLSAKASRLGIEIKILREQENQGKPK